MQHDRCCVSFILLLQTREKENKCSQLKLFFCEMDVDYNSNIFCVLLCIPSSRAYKCTYLRFVFSSVTAFVHLFLFAIHSISKKFFFSLLNERVRLCANVFNMQYYTMQLEQQQYTHKIEIIPKLTNTCKLNGYNWCDSHDWISVTLDFILNEWCFFVSFVGWFQILRIIRNEWVNFAFEFDTENAINRLNGDGLLRIFQFYKHILFAFSVAYTILHRHTWIENRTANLKHFLLRVRPCRIYWMHFCQYLISI